MSDVPKTEEQKAATRVYNAAAKRVSRSRLKQREVEEAQRREEELRGLKEDVECEYRQRKRWERLRLLKWEVGEAMIEKGYHVMSVPVDEEFLRVGDMVAKLALTGESISHCQVRACLCVFSRMSLFCVSGGGGARHEEAEQGDSPRELF